MIKALYLTPTSLVEHSGIDKKIIAQYQVLKNNNLDIKLCFIERKENFEIARKIIDNGLLLKYFKSTNKYTRKLYSIYLSWNFNDVYKYILKNNIKLIYIRYESSSNYGFIKFLKKLKEINVKILIEIPTYPYDMEILNGSLKSKIRYIIEKHYRKNLKKYVNRIITFSKDDEIYGVNTIKISNGINLDKISILNKKVKNTNGIDFIGVAGIAPWHGFDRFILSMAKYYKNNPKEIIRFHIVGNGQKDIMDFFKKIVMENNLEDYIIFYGYKSGKELDDIYNKTDIAIGSLGIHRIGLAEVQPLKNREYCAKGLPFIISFNDPNFINKKFVYKVSNNEELFDINEIIAWYENLKISPEEMREYSKQFTWDIQMKKVVEYLEEK